MKEQTKNYLADAVKIKAKVLENIRTAMYRNHYMVAYIEGCRLVGATEVEAKMDLLFHLLKREGDVPSTLYLYRLQLLKELLEVAATKMDHLEYVAFAALFNTPDEQLYI
jgi:hypothetical protein